jgi:LDH2 family malate/lactate/ureidoglycolate dehydrogenase
MELPEEATPVSFEKMVDFASRAYEAAGVPPADARKAGAALADSDLHSTFTHGLKNLKGYVDLMTSGKINPRARVHEVGGPEAAKIWSADNAPGHVAGGYGMERAIELAREFGVGTVFMRDSNHYGASGYWARLALQHNMVGYAFSNAPANMAPYGAKRAMVGNNPPAWAIPSRIVDEGEPLPAGESDPAFLDIALSVVAGNRLDIFRRRGEDIPLGWALDSDGNPTTKAAARAAGGSFTPIADYKGSGLAIVLSAIDSFLAGGPFDDQRFADGPGSAQLYGTCNHWFAAYDIKQFIDLETFTVNVRSVQERIRALEPRAGFEQVYAPGDIENERARRWRTEGVPLEDFVLEELALVAEHLGLEFNLP